MLSDLQSSHNTKRVQLNKQYKNILPTFTYSIQYTNLQIIQGFIEVHGMNQE